MGNEAEGRVAIVTGASRGIGQAIALRLAAEGAQVAVVGRGENRSTDLAGSLEETVERIRAACGRAPIVVRADIADPELDKRTLVAEVAAQAGANPDVLVHSAAAPREFGGGRPSIPFAELDRAFFQRAVDVNVWAFWDLAARRDLVGAGGSATSAGVGRRAGHGRCARLRWHEGVPRPRRHRCSAGARPYACWPAPPA